MDFNGIITNRIKEKNYTRVNNDFQKLAACFRNFILKYSCDGSAADFVRIKEYTLKSLKESKGHSGDFIMFPELEGYLFKKESTRITNQLLYPHEVHDPEDTSIIPNDNTYIDS